MTSSASSDQTRPIRTLYLLYVLRGGKEKCDTEKFRFETIEEYLNAKPVLTLQSLVGLYELGVFQNLSVEVLARIGDKPLEAHSRSFALDRGFEPSLYELEILSFKNEYTPVGSHHKEISRTYSFQIDSEAAQDLLEDQILSWSHNFLFSPSGASLYDSAVQLAALLKDIRDARETDTPDALTIPETQGDSRMEKLLAALWLEKEGLIAIDKILWENHVPASRIPQGYCPSLLISLGHEFSKRIPSLSDLDSPLYRTKLSEIMGTSEKIRITPSGEWIGHERYSPRSDSFARLLGQLLVKKQALEIPWLEVLIAQGKQRQESHKAPLDMRKALSNLKGQLERSFHIRDEDLVLRGAKIILSPNTFQLSPPDDLGISGTK